MSFGCVWCGGRSHFNCKLDSAMGSGRVSNVVVGVVEVMRVILELLLATFPSLLPCLLRPRRKREHCAKINSEALSSPRPLKPKGSSPACDADVFRCPLLLQGKGGAEATAFKKRPSSRSSRPQLRTYVRRALQQPPRRPCPKRASTFCLNFMRVPP